VESLAAEAFGSSNIASKYSMEAIVTYSEVTLAGKRKYELYPDRIVTRGSGYLVV
jgi:hypothetical protein